MRNEIARQITESLHLRDVMEFYGVRFNGRGFAICPFHAEKTASLSIKNEHYKCFGCGVYGDAVDFVMAYHGLAFTQAVVRLDSDFHLGITGRRPAYRERIQADENRRVADAEAKWRAGLMCQYSSLCDVRRALYGRFISGEEWLGGIIERLDVLLDDFTGEEALAWEMAISEA